ncbi:fungal-specific transcription factor domain-containing protein [Xylaria digitata]|nr:fungal-specific transcription factor domain-containing protein [Xylaria digitata]
MSEESPRSTASRPRYSRKRHISVISTPDDHNQENEGGRKAYKASRACDLCKAMKVRCSGTIPCDRCVLRRRKCVYDAVYLRGRPPTPPPASRAQPEQRRDEQRATGPDELTPAGTRIVTPHSTELDGAEVEGQYLDHTGLTFLHRAHRRLAMQQRQSMNPHVIPRTGPMQQLTWAGDKSLRLGTPGLSELGSLSLSFLVDNVRTVAQTYFETCVVTYRMFHKSTVLGWLDVVSAHPDSEAQTQTQTEAHRLFPLSLAIGNAKASILLTLMAITTLRTEKTKNRFDGAWDEEHVLPQTDHYFQLALTLTESEIGPATLESAQARLIQVLYLLQTARMNRAWYQLGAAYQVIAALGLHRKQNSWGQESANSHVNAHNISNITPTSISPNNYIALQCQLRTFWVAYSMDVYMSVVLGRPRYFHDDDINQAFPASINDEDMAPHGPLYEFRDPGIASYSRARAESNMDSMIAHVQLSRIIGTISRTVYSLKSLPKQERLEAARRCGQSLRAWRAGLPPHLNSIHPSSLIPSLRRQAIALQLAYCHAVIHTNRPFLLGTEGITDEHAEPTEGPPEDYHQAADESIAECIAAAHTALHTVESIVSDISVVNALWWMPYVSFCALAVVYPRDSEHDFQNILALAERCHLLLSQDFRSSTGSSASFPPQMADSPSRRYSIVLEELRLEARDHSARNTLLSLQPTAALDTPNSTIEATATMSRHQQVMAQNTMAAQSPVQDQGDTSNISGEATFNYVGDIYSANAADTATTGLLPISFQEWQTSDWLGLDASAFGLYLDSNTTFGNLY